MCEEECEPTEGLLGDPSADGSLAALASALIVVLPALRRYYQP
jgi:hypothetical protein